MRNQFDEQLKQLKNMLVEMGTLIETAIGLAVKALCEQDTSVADKTLALEKEINQYERNIEALCLKLLLQQQPVARDLRLISAGLKMITDMERIGDQATDIAGIAKILAGTVYIKKLEHIPQMAEATIKMVSESIDAFVNTDLVLAQNVIGYDDVVDDLFQTVRQDLIELVRADNGKDEQAMYLLMVAKYFERIGDHAVNIAEWVSFSITGVHAKNGS